MAEIASFWLRHWRCVLWGIAVALWALALTTPQPARLNRETFHDEPLMAFTAAKTLHIGVYALLTATSGLLGATGWRRFLFPIGMVLHGALTEYIQYSFPQLERHGCVQDVVINTSGVILGLAAGWLLGWWRFRD